MILDTNIMIYSCNCKIKGIKEKSNIEHEGYPVFLCKKCMGKLTEEKK